MSAPTARQPGLSNLQVRCQGQQLPWIWEGVLAIEAVTLLSAPAKTGKTTLVSLLLDRRRQGGQLLGRRVGAGGTILCSEEENRLWALRQPPLNFGDQVHYHRPCDEPSPKTWVRFIDEVIEHCFPLDRGCDLFIIDSARTFLPAARNNPATLRNALRELRVVAHMGVAILLLHQSAERAGRDARNPLEAFADILIDLRRPAGAGLTDRRRCFHGVGRYPGTLQHVAAELNAEGTDYLLLPDQPAPVPALEVLRQVVAGSTTPLTRQEILARWPTSAPPPHADALSRTLARACQQGMLARSGAGARGEPYRYGVAGVE